jgi:4'-phosphopantetheinyl transferase EntD
VIDDILPDYVVAAEAFGDDLDGRLFPEEEAVIRRSVDKRRREFATARHCARRALARLGRPPAAILPGAHGQPVWPAGVRGSITHCAGYRAAVLGTTDAVAAIGIDAEPHRPLPDDVLEAVALPQEQRLVRALLLGHPGVHWDRLLFSAKETVYKAWFPLTGHRLDFADALITFIPASGAFTARLLSPGPTSNGEPRPCLSGRWLAGNGLAVTAIVIPAGSTPA